MKTSGCISIFGSLLTVHSVSASDAVHPYMLQFSTTTSYMFAPELRDSTICSTSYDLVLGDSVTYMIIHPVSASLISFIYVILRHWFRLVLLGHAQMIHYVLSIQLYLYTFWIYYVLSIWTHFWLSMGMPTLAWVESLFSFIGFWQAEIWWSPPLSLRSLFYVHNTF